MRTFFEVDKKLPLKEATKLAEEAKEIGGYDFCDLINYCSSGIDWQHPTRLKRSWVYVLSKRNRGTGLVHEEYPLYGCPHGIGKDCVICKKMERKQLDDFVKENLATK